MGCNAERWHSRKDREVPLQNEMAVNEERMERVPAFYWIIEDHVLLALSCKINTTELRRARARIYVPNLKIDFDPFENPYFVAYRCLLDMFHNHRQKIEKLIVPDQTVDFIFDNQTEKHAIKASWEGYINSRPDSIKSLYGAAPRFEDDQISLPLQAADFWAWWVRKWYEEGSPDKMKTCDFGKWRGEKPPPGMAISFDEDHLLNELRNIIRSGIELGRPIYDVQFSWRSS
jgi:hypothetical protein